LTLEEYRSLQIGDEVILVGNLLDIGIGKQELVDDKIVGTIKSKWNSRDFYGIQNPWVVNFLNRSYIVPPAFLERALCEKICPTCDGAGFIEVSPTCPDCQGQGIICL